MDDLFVFTTESSGVKRRQRKLPSVEYSQMASSAVRVCRLQESPEVREIERELGGSGRNDHVSDPSNAVDDETSLLQGMSEDGGSATPTDLSSPAGCSKAQQPVNEEDIDPFTYRPPLTKWDYLKVSQCSS